MFDDWKIIKNRNGNSISRLIIYSLLLEKKYPIFSIIRTRIWGPITCTQILPDSFTRESLLSLRLPHPFMIIIHPNSKIGVNCTIYHEVTIGCIEHISQISPQIGNNCYIGCKAALLGEMELKDCTIVGAGSILKHNHKEKV